MATTNKSRIMIYGPKTGGTYVIEFRTAAGEALAISVPPERDGGVEALPGADALWVVRARRSVRNICCAHLFKPRRERGFLYGKAALHGVNDPPTGGSHGKPHRTTKILSHAWRRGSDMAACGAGRARSMRLGAWMQISSFETPAARAPRGRGLRTCPWARLVIRVFGVRLHSPVGDAGGDQQEAGTSAQRHGRGRQTAA